MGFGITTRLSVSCPSLFPLPHSLPASSQAQKSAVATPLRRWTAVSGGIEASHFFVLTATKSTDLALRKAVSISMSSLNVQETARGFAAGSRVYITALPLKDDKRDSVAGSSTSTEIPKGGRSATLPVSMKTATMREKSTRKKGSSSARFSFRFSSLFTSSASSTEAPLLTPHLESNVINCVRKNLERDGEGGIESALLQLWIPGHFERKIIAACREGYKVFVAACFEKPVDLKSKKKTKTAKPAKYDKDQLTPGKSALERAIRQHLACVGAAEIDRRIAAKLIIMEAELLSTAQQRKELEPLKEIKKALAPWLCCPLTAFGKSGIKGAVYSHCKSFKFDSFLAHPDLMSCQASIRKKLMTEFMDKYNECIETEIAKCIDNTCKLNGYRCSDKIADFLSTALVIERVNFLAENPSSLLLFAKSCDLTDLTFKPFCDLVDSNSIILTRQQQQQLMETSSWSALFDAVWAELNEEREDAFSRDLDDIFSKEEDA